MKLIVRIDDVGYTPVFNQGAFKTIDNGITTHVDLMLDMPGSADAMQRLRAYPWISVGWHDHFWGRPVADPARVSSLLDENGDFKFSFGRPGKEEVRYEEALVELRAQLERCVHLMGRAPDIAWINGDTPLDRAKEQVCREFGVACNTGTRIQPITGKRYEARPAYASAGIFMPDQVDSAYRPCYAEDALVREAYDPVRYFVEDWDHLLQQKVALVAFHPGFMDDYILQHYGFWRNPRGPQRFSAQMLRDVAALCSDELHQWIREKHVELVSHTDALYGTRHYQNHLRDIGSDLVSRKGENDETGTACG